MSRKSQVLAGVMVHVAVLAALSGCSSSDDAESPKAAPTSGHGAPAASRASASPSRPVSTSSSGSQGDEAGGVHGRLDYTGSRTGGFDVHSSVGCRTLAGELRVVSAPDADAGSASALPVPSFLATVGGTNIVRLITPDDHTFYAVGTKSLSAAEQDGVLTVTVSDLELGEAGDSVTLNGELTCTKMYGT